MRISPFASMVWFMGVVENIVDPKGMNRVQVRCMHYHTEDRTQLPTEDLPWAPMINSGDISANGLLPSDWIIGFFLDGQEAQQPVVFGKIDGIPKEKDSTIGFSDPAGIYPKKLNKPTNSPLARGDLSDTNPITYSKGSVTKGVKTADGGTWDEPESAYAAEYPHNHVWETPAQNVIESDGTPGAERIHIFHHAGSLIEFHPDGKVVHRVLDAGFEIVVKNKNVTVGGDFNLSATGNINLLAGGKITLAAGSDLVAKIGGNIDFGAEGQASIKAGAEFAVDAASIDINSGVAESPGTPDTPTSVTVSKFDPDK